MSSGIATVANHLKNRTPRRHAWGLLDLAEQLGNMTPARIRWEPAPGTATRADLIRMNEYGDAFCELIAGTLVEKTRHCYESFLTVELAGKIGFYLDDNPLGYLLGTHFCTEFLPNIIRAPDLSFYLWEKTPNRRVVDEAIGSVLPELVVEILNIDNTPKEMSDKLKLYLSASVTLIWYVDPRKEEVAIYAGSETPVVLCCVRMKRWMAGMYFRGCRFHSENCLMPGEGRSDDYARARPSPLAAARVHPALPRETLAGSGMASRWR